METEEFTATCNGVIAKLQKKKQRIQEAQSKPKRLLRSRESVQQLQARRFMNPLTHPDNVSMIEYLPNQIKQSLLSLSKINVQMINQIRIAAPSNSNQGLKNMKRALRLFQQSIQSIPQLDFQKVIPSRSTIGQQGMQPQQVYTLYLADKIQQLCNIGVSTPKNISQRKQTQFDNFGMKEMQDFYQFGTDRIF